MDVTFSDGTIERYEDRPWRQGAGGTFYKSVDGRHLIRLQTNFLSFAISKLEFDKILGEYNVVRGDPYWEQLFAWPDKLVVDATGNSAKNGGIIGVRVPLVTGLTQIDRYFYPEAYNYLSKEQQGWWIGRVAVAIKLARALGRLHTSGIYYGDFSDVKVLVDPLEGKLRLVDCDLLVVPGVPYDAIGTIEYMAPEEVSGQVKTPSVETDRHSLAVRLYRWLLYRHPLLGPKQHDPDPDRDERLALGERALYIEHPTDTSNRPKSAYISADTLTPRLRDLFRTAFVDALYMPAKRPLPAFWEAALIEVFDRIVPCSNPACPQKFFVAQEAQSPQCPLCNTPLTFPGGKVPFLKLRRPVQDHGTVQYRDEGIYAYYVVGWPERPLYAWHAYPHAKPVPDATGTLPDTKPHAMFQFDSATSEWYLQNLNLPNLTVKEASGRQGQPVALGAYVPLHQNTQLFLGSPESGRTAFVEFRRVQASNLRAPVVRMPLASGSEKEQWPRLLLTPTQRSFLPQGQLETMTVEAIPREFVDAEAPSAPAQQVAAGASSAASSLPIGHVFVSYSRHDSTLVERLCNDLRVKGLAAWVDSASLMPGTHDWEEAIRKAISTVDAVILVASPSSRQSSYVRDELDVAKLYQRPIYPVWADGDSWIDAIPLGWGRAQYCDVRGPQYAKGVRDLLSALGVS